MNKYKFLIILISFLFIIISCSEKDTVEEAVREEVLSSEREFIKLRRKAMSYMYQSSWYLAIENFEKALHIKPTDPNVLYFLGISYGHLASIDIKYAIKARDILNRYIVVKPDDAVGYYSLAILSYYNFDDLDEALKLIDIAISLDPNDEKAFVAKGTFSYFAGRFSESIDNYKIAISLANTRTRKARYSLNIARVYKRWGRLDDARVYGQQSLTFWSNYQDARSFLNSF